MLGRNNREEIFFVNFYFVRVIEFVIKHVKSMGKYFHKNLSRVISFVEREISFVARRFSIFCDSFGVDAKID
jgi:hypothetical protein